MVVFSVHLHCTLLSSSSSPLHYTLGQRPPHCKLNSPPHHLQQKKKFFLKKKKIQSLHLTL